jgi:hypothetical protein
VSETDEIAAFIGARLDEEEAAAKAATPGPWISTGQRDKFVESALSGRIVAEMDQFAGEGDSRAANAAHIARHGPARTLREVTIGRRRILRYRAAVACAGGDYDPVLSAICIELWDAVSAWNDHPDYKELWAKAGKPAGAEDDPGNAESFDHERSRAKALEIHAATCSDPAWCNYGEPEPPEHADDESLPWPQRQDLARLRLRWMRHCMAAVNAENRAGDRD